MDRPVLDRRTFCLGSAAILAGIGAASPPAPARVSLGVGASLQGVRPFPDADPWNQPVAGLPVDPRSDLLIRGIGLDQPLHADFGTIYGNRPIGLSYVVVPGDQPRVPVRFDAYSEESDQGPYPIPLDAPIEGGPHAAVGDDRHVLVIDRAAWKLYELFAASREGNGGRRRGRSIGSSPAPTTCYGMTTPWGRSDGSRGAASRS